MHWGFKQINFIVFLTWCSLPLIPALGYFGPLSWSMALGLLGLAVMGISVYAVSVRCPFCGVRFAKGQMQWWWWTFFLWKQGAKCPRCSKPIHF